MYKSVLRTLKIGNEGFEYARDPWAEVDVEEADAPALIAWVETTYGLSRLSTPMDRAFRTRTHPGRGPVRSLPDARVLLAAAVTRWQGL